MGSRPNGRQWDLGSVFYSQQLAAAERRRLNYRTRPYELL